MSLSASLQKVDHRIFLKGEHQAAALYLGQLALSDLAAADFAALTSAIVNQVLQTGYCLFWRLKEDSPGLFLIAGSGEIGILSTSFSLPLVSNSLEAATLSSTVPVLVDNSKNTFDLSFWGSVAVQQITNGASLRIGTMEKPYGILQVFSAREQLFSQSDIYFLQSIANLMGMILHQESCEQGQVTGVRMNRTQSTIQSQQLEWDRNEIKNRLVESQERERLRLAQELHDIPIQDLYGMIYQLDDLRDAVKDTEGEKTLDECDGTLHRVVNSLRMICRELRPPSLSPFGLEVAIRDHVEKFSDQNPDISIHLELMQDRQVLSDGIRLALFRIYQQAILNVARHAQASDVHIRFRWDEQMIILEVEDNGIGFEVPASWVELVREEHFGLLGIAERIESIRGKLEIVSAPGNGTLVRAIAPYSRNDNN